MLAKIVISFVAFIGGVIAAVLASTLVICLMEKMRARLSGVMFLGTVYKIGEGIFIALVVLFFLAAGTSAAYDMIYGVK